MLKRSTLATLLATPALALSGSVEAQAYEFKPAWGYAYIDDNPFNDPAAGGALLPSTRVFPRGYIRDTAVDNRDVRLTLFVFTPGKSSAAASYTVNEGDFKNITIDRRLDIWPSQISYLRYDFCRFNPSNGAVDACVESLRIGRPAEPTPTPTPTPTPVGATPPPSPTDADGDGVPAPADCWDQNATVFPGAPEVPGNAIDDDCTGGDAPARVAGTIQSKWETSSRRVAVKRLRIVDAPQGSRVDVTCSGARCPFKRRSATVDAKGNANLRKFFKHRLRPSITIDVRLTYPNTIGRVGRFPIKRVDVPDMQRLCLPPGTTKPQRC